MKQNPEGPISGKQKFKKKKKTGKNEYIYIYSLINKYIFA